MPLRPGVDRALAKPAVAAAELALGAGLRSADSASRPVAFDVVGMRRQHFAILSALADGGPSSQASSPASCGIDRSDMVAVIAELERAGMVRRARDASDRPQHAVTSTRPASYALGQLDAQVEDAQRELLAPLSAAERAQLTWLLTPPRRAPHGRALSAA